MRAAWWWIDRWRKSSAFSRMSLAAQGAYRNLLDELWLRDGVLPLEDRHLARVCGDPFAWDEVREEVLAHFVKTPEGWRNETHDKVMEESRKRAARQKRYRDKKRNVTANVGPSPSPSLSKDQSPSPKKEPPNSPPGGFVRFWDLFPNKTEKQNALLLWTGKKPFTDKKKRNLEPHADEVISGLEAQSQWREDMGRFRPDEFVPLWKGAASWLRDMRWKDEVPEVGDNGQPRRSTPPECGCGQYLNLPEELERGECNRCDREKERRMSCEAGG